VIKVVHENAARAAALIGRVLRQFPAEHEPCPVGSDRALDNAIMTDASLRDPALVAKLDAVAGRVLGC
jgi:5'-methylthioadenosine phosphorylase